MVRGAAATAGAHVAPGIEVGEVDEVDEVGEVGLGLGLA
jgi:hypothetical protein